jgi:hypothetical protein
MRAPRFRFPRLATLALTVCLLLVPAVRAQDEEEDKPFQEPGITYRQTQKPYIEWLAGMLIVVACLLIAAKNPHRTHLD